MAKKKGKTWRVSADQRANGLYSDLLRKNGPRAYIELDKKKVIPRKKKYKERFDEE